MALRLLDAGNELRVYGNDTDDSLVAIVNCRFFDGRDAKDNARWGWLPRSEWFVRFVAAGMSLADVKGVVDLLPQRE